MPREFNTLEEFGQRLLALPTACETTIAAAHDRNSQLTKPGGALGNLETLAIWYAGWRRDARPVLTSSQVIVFAGNHGVAQNGVSAFPPEVTAQMVQNFTHGGAAINQLSNFCGANLAVHALDLDTPTADFTQGPAMSEQECVDALYKGWQSVDTGAHLLVVGEMGIGNTTSAAAICNALYGGDAHTWAGRGTGVDDDGLSKKYAAITAGLAANPSASHDPFEALRCLGGREIAAMAGAIVKARECSIPVILDGFMCCAAAAVLARRAACVLDHTVAGHLSAEGAHARLLDALNKKPLLNLGLRLGEASGGALAINILKAALACHNGMATFKDAMVSEGA